MKILVLCDLHNEFGEIDFDLSDCDAVVLAGDTDIGIRGAKWAIDRFRGIPIIYICGNHEYYGKKIYKVHRQLEEISRENDFFFLERDQCVVGDVRFLGCTLWSDFDLFGNNRMSEAIFEAKRQMTDFRRIRLGAEYGYRKLKPSDAQLFHQRSVQFLEKQLTDPFDGVTIVVTHHAPSPQSLPEALRGDIISSSYCSDIEWLIEKYKPQYWIHGHIHEALDYMISDTRIICNARGYTPDIVKGFVSDYMLEV